MAIQPKVLAQGFFSNNMSTLYVSPATLGSYVKFFNIYNSGSISQEIILQVSSSLGTNTFERITLGSHQSARVIGKEETFMFNLGSAIKGLSTNDATVEYVIIGGEEN